MLNYFYNKWISGEILTILMMIGLIEHFKVGLLTLDHKHTCILFLGKLNTIRH